MLPDSNTKTEPGALVSAGIAALRAGDAKTATLHLEQALAVQGGNAQAWLALAMARRALHDEAGAIAAAEKALAIEPRSVRAYLLKADSLAASGRSRTAYAFYDAAIRLGAEIGRLPEDLVLGLRRAEEAQRHYTRDLDEHIRARLAQAGLGERPGNRRFWSSLDLLSGTKEIYYKQPRAYYFPELPQIQFYERQSLPWLERVEAATDSIREELSEILKEGDRFEPYLREDPDMPLQDPGRLRMNADWRALFLSRDGALVNKNAARCPRTLAALEEAPLMRVRLRGPSILFSASKTAARIPPHVGFLNVLLICHLPLIVPTDCHLRVGNETRTFVSGKAWAFDDSFEHEAWNASDETRIILIFDIWRPELSEDECALVAALLEAIDGYGADAPELWKE